MEQIMTLAIYPLREAELLFPVLQHIKAGFLSTAIDYTEEAVDLHKLMIRNPDSTFVGRVEGDSMKDKGIDDKDIALIDKSIAARDGKMVVCHVNGCYTIKTLRKSNDESWLISANEKYPPIKLSEYDNAKMFGVVTWILKKIP